MALSPCNSAANGQGRELVEHGTPLFPAACYHDDLETDTVPWHWHDELEVILVETGSVVVSAEGENRTLRAGEGCFLSAGALHRVRRERGPGRLHSLVFHPRLVGGSIESIFWQRYLQPLLSDAACRFVPLSAGVPWQREALEALEAAWRSGVLEPPGFEFAVREELSKLILLLCLHRPAEQKSPSEKALRDGERIKIMLRFIQAHYSEELTAAEIAASAAVSESECLRCFRSMIGTTPIQYVKQLRIQRAAELLAATDRKISEIGADCGFQEMSYFARTFRALKGRTPSQYRAEKRGARG